MKIRLLISSRTLSKEPVEIYIADKLPSVGSYIRHKEKLYKVWANDNNWSPAVHVTEQPKNI